MATTANLLLTAGPTSGTSNECRMLLNVARYYDVISKIVDVLDQLNPPVAVSSLQVIHKPEALSILIFYGELIEDCSLERKSVAEVSIKQETLDLKVKLPPEEGQDLQDKLPPEDALDLQDKIPPEEALDLQDKLLLESVPEVDFVELEEDAIIEEQDQIYYIEDQSELLQDAADDMSLDDTDLVEEEQLAESENEPDFEFEQEHNDCSSTVSEYFVEYLQDDGPCESEANECIEDEGGGEEPDEGTQVDPLMVKTNNIFLIRYKCQFISCSKKFMFSKEYDEHIRKEHTGIVKPPIELQCKHNECTARFDDTFKLYVHHKSHRGQQVVKPKARLTCQLCEVKFGSKIELKRHVKEHPELSLSKGGAKHNLKRKCEFCEEILEPKINLYNIHCLEAHGRALYNCFVCGKTFYLLTHLSEHIKTGHDTETAKSFITESLWRTFANGSLTTNECRMCFRLFASSKAELQHQEHHLKELSLTCANCGGKHYESQCNEPRPKFTAVYEKVQCDQCQRWMSKKNIKEHLATHANERNYPCTVCKKTFKVQRTAHRHIQNHINAQNKLRKCYDCDEVFDDEEFVAEHYQQGHPDKRPYNCLICGEGFYLKTQLADHSHTHTDEERKRISIKNPVEHYQIGNARVYECTLCRRAFSAKRTTVAHFIVHTDRPFVCEQCSMSFRVKTALEDHLLDVHKVKL